LVSNWTADEHRRSLRELVEQFNLSVLWSALEDAGSRPLEGEVQNLYGLLTDEEVSSGVRT
jgi:hypothetical protein